ncbi:MAG TPA: cytochrome c [Methylibium sp.]|nr:cytochrome c [Methylibium sp.]
MNTRRWALAGAGAIALGAMLAAAVLALNRLDEAPLDSAPPPAAADDAATVARGAYLARAGNCAGCHTARGGAEYAGGRGIDTPFGRVYAPNLTPDRETGLGGWSAEAFWRALHNGRAKDGRLLYPAFPYPNYTRVTRADADAIYRYLRSLAPVRQANRPHALRFPYGTQAALAVWRALFFRPARFEPEAGRSAAWNRGSYLVRGLGHCEACHAERNWFGATRGGLELGGGLIPMQGWYAPSLAAPGEAGVQEWTEDEVVALLGGGVTPRGSVMGPMAEVVFRSTGHLNRADLQAMALFLKSLPRAATRGHHAPAADGMTMRRGEVIYRDHCAACHGERGEGAAGLYPPLAGNRAVVLTPPHNVVRAIVHGGFAPTTKANPRPYGMPPFAQVLSDADVANVATYIRNAWGSAAPEVSRLDVLNTR